jgi:hypothetical protein
LVVTKLSNNYTQTTSRCRIQLELETSLGKALIEENGYSLVEINNDGDDPFSPCPKGAKLKNQSCVAILANGVTINYAPRLDLIS